MKFSQMKVIWVVAVLLASCTNNEQLQVSQQDRCIEPTQGQMVWIPAGSFVMGEDPFYAEEGPPETIHLDGFWMSIHEVTNHEFAAFVAATGYVTVAERKTLRDSRAQTGEFSTAAIFSQHSADHVRTWIWSHEAHWRMPSGSNDAIAGKENHPVVQIAYEDAVAFARWVSQDLPTEAQWEYAARAGGDSVPIPLDVHGNPQANYYQGSFPSRDEGVDGYTSRAPVGCFDANEFGLYDMIGNVWEWTSDTSKGRDSHRIVKGGSFLCSENYCARYRAAARQFQELGTATEHIGFRLVDNYRLPPRDATL